MIFPLIEFLSLILLTGIAHGILRPMALNYLNSQVSAYPTYFDTAMITFITSCLNYLGLFILIGGMIGLWVWVHRTTSEGYIR